MWSAAFYFWLEEVLHLVPQIEFRSGLSGRGGGGFATSWYYSPRRRPSEYAWDHFPAWSYDSVMFHEWKESRHLPKCGASAGALALVFSWMARQFSDSKCGGTFGGKLSICRWKWRFQTHPQCLSLFARIRAFWLCLLRGSAGSTWCFEESTLVLYAISASWRSEHECRVWRTSFESGGW